MRKYILRACLCAVTFGTAVTWRPSIAPAQAARASGRACVFDHQMLWTPVGTCQPEALVYPARVTSKVQRAIYDGALTFDLPYRALLKVARCESGLNPKARNGSYRGLFQFLPATFRRASTRMRRETGIVSSNVWSPRDSTYAAAYMFVTNLGGDWGCARTTL